ncbi:class I SAM-dependent methyltransferase [Nanoarchaeota archaeon]
MAMFLTLSDVTTGMTLVSKSKTKAIDRLRMEKRYGKLLAYHILRLSELGRESTENQGSARCMELLYQNKAQGRMVLGKIVDYFLLRLPVSKATRERRGVVVDLVRKQMPCKKMLYVPCGTASELKVLARRYPETEFFGLDLDTKGAKRNTKGLRNVKIMKCNAFDYSAYPAGRFDVVLTIGLVDYLSLDETSAFYRRLKGKLKKDGVLITSVIGTHKHADSLMKEFADFSPVYKTKKDLVGCLRKAGFKAKVWLDDHGIHSFGVAKLVKKKKF